MKQPREQIAMLGITINKQAAEQMRHKTLDTASATASGNLVLLPRLIRLKDASGYLGMDRNKFNADVRPYLTEIPLGKQAIAFNRLELDAWVDDYIERNGRRPKA
jgi:predicted DNA-binding transcriptional regulator AlpA